MLHFAEAEARNCLLRRQFRKTQKAKEMSQPFQLTHLISASPSIIHGLIPVPGASCHHRVEQTSGGGQGSVDVSRDNGRCRCGWIEVKLCILVG